MCNDTSLVFAYGPEYLSDKYYDYQECSVGIRGHESVRIILSVHAFQAQEEGPEYPLVCT